MMGLGKLGDLGNLMKGAQEMQTKFAEVQERLGNMLVVGESGGGMVIVEANGRQEILSVVIESVLMADGDREMAQDLIVAATNDALAKSRELAQQETGRIMGDLPAGLGDIAGMMNPGE